MTQAKEEINDETNQKLVLEFIQSVVVNKFPNLSPEGIKAMLDLTDDIENTAYYKSIMKKTLLNAAQKLLEEGDSIERVARVFNLDIEEVRKLAEKQG